MVRVTRKTTPCCGSRWLWEVLCGIRVWRDVAGRKIYRARCGECGSGYDLDGGIVR